MTKFIRVTEVHSNGRNVDIIINVENILAIKVSDRTEDIHISLKGEKYLFVKESVDEIWQQINTDMSKAPVIMTAEEALIYYKQRDGV